MTRYEELTRKIEALEQKAAEASEGYVRSIWLRHANELKEIRRNLSIAEASEEVSS